MLDHGYYADYPQIGKKTFKIKACADDPCTVYVESNLITITTYCTGSSSFLTTNIIHPISDNV